MTTVITQGYNHRARRCDARCHDAKRPHCDCICGGRNHGVGLQQAIRNNQEHYRPLIEKLNRKGWKIKLPDGSQRSLLPDEVTP